MPQSLTKSREISYRELDVIRGNWYAWAYAYRQRVAAMSPTMQATLLNVSLETDPCPITLYGGPPAWWPSIPTFRLAAVYRIDDPELLNQWFTSPEGWERYVYSFEHLPDPLANDELSTAACVYLDENLPVIHKTPELSPKIRSSVIVIPTSRKFIHR